jgi:lysophospholipase L1-like esterase
MTVNISNNCNLVIDGNSILTNETAPFPLVAEGLGESLASLLRRRGIIGITTTNIAVQSQTTRQMIANGAKVDALLSSSRQNVLLVFEGLNDLFFYGYYAEPNRVILAVNNIASYCADRQSAGWEVILMLSIPTDRGFFDTPQQPQDKAWMEADALAYDSYVLQGNRSLPFANYVFHTRRWVPEYNFVPPYSDDGLHPNTFGAALIASRLSDLVS